MEKTSIIVHTKNQQDVKATKDHKIVFNGASFFLLANGKTSNISRSEFKRLKNDGSIKSLKTNKNTEYFDFVL